MNLKSEAQKLANDLGLSEADAIVMKIKAQLYQEAANCIQKSKLSHEKIAKSIGTSRARITRIANSGENSISLELLIKIIVSLEGRCPIQVGA